MTIEPNPVVDRRALQAVPFHGDRIVTFERDGARFVAMRRIVQNMGLSWPRQSTKLMAQRDKFSCCLMATTGSDGKAYDMIAMSLEKFPLWLACINPAKIGNAVVRAKVERYQAESAAALYAYWARGMATRADAEPPRPAQVLTLDRRLAAEIGGIIKGVVARRDEELIQRLLPAAIEAHAARLHVVVRRGVTAGQVWTGAGLPRLKNGARWLGNRLAEMGAMLPGRAEAGERTARLFDPDLSHACLKNGLAAKARTYASERAGQTRLKLVPKET